MALSLQRQWNAYAAGCRGSPCGRLSLVTAVTEFPCFEIVAYRASRYSILSWDASAMRRTLRDGSCCHPSLNVFGQN
jgi:hypothetical protein